MPCLSPRVFAGSVISCKKCEYCTGIRRWYYRSRVLAEQVVSPRTWFVTLTLRRNMSDQVGYLIVQRWMKRVRKRMQGSCLRYACVAEHGSQRTRRLHYHVVLHGPATLTQRVIRSAWRGGISQASLVESGNDVSRYSTKMAGYATKGGKFRFSIGYGQRALASHDIFRAIQATFLGDDLVVRVAGSRLHRDVIPEFRPHFLIGSELWREAESCRPRPFSVPKRKLVPMRDEPTTQNGGSGGA